MTVLMSPNSPVCRSGRQGYRRIIAWLLILACLIGLMLPYGNADAASFRWPWSAQPTESEPASEVETVTLEATEAGEAVDMAVDQVGVPPMISYPNPPSVRAYPAPPQSTVEDVTADDARPVDPDTIYISPSRDGADHAVMAPSPAGHSTPARRAGERERISLFASDIAVQTNGDLLVTERIRVVSNGDEIKRGIVRDFPTRYRTPGGLNVKVGMEVQSVSRDGFDEPYAVTRIANGVRIRMGQADVLLDRGVHEYVIRYRTTRQIGFFDTFDELYWNVTGSDWTFPIEVATARITLPAQVAIQNTAVYTGPHGSRGAAAEEVSRGPGQVEFRTTEALGVREGLTVAASWPTGIVHPPSLQQIAFYWVRDNLVLGTAVLGAVLLIGYYLVCAFRVRRRSPRLVVPLFEPPQGMSAPAVRFVVKQRLDDQVFTVAMLELIALRWMRMTRQPDDDVEFVRLSGRPGAAPPDDPVLKQVLNKMFGTSSKFLRDELGSNRLQDGEDLLEERVHERWSGLFNSGRRMARRGTLWWFVYTAVCAAVTWMVEPNNLPAVLGGLAFGIPGAAALAFIVRSWWRTKFTIGSFLFALLFVAPFLFGGVALLLTNTRPFITGALPGLLPLAFLPVVISAYQFLRGYTEEGALIRDQIDGFKQYLKIAEGPRLTALTTPEERLEVFERFLPYAVALDVGRDWSEAFAKFFQGTAALAMIDSMQRNYAGHDMLRENPTNAARAFSHDIVSQSEDDSDYVTSSSSSSPGSSSSSSSRSSSSSSSGSSGGGSSGGGGGGGGGSGW